MLRLTIEAEEFFDDSTQTFLDVGSEIVDLEHSLVSLSKWESKFEKPFLSTTDKSKEETLAYVECMILTPNYNRLLIQTLSGSNLTKVNEYVNSPQSATTFGHMPETKGRGETITSELIYYWMVAFNIPFECQDWHLNRLFSLIRICNLKQGKQKKMSKHEMAQKYRDLNEQRKAALGTSG